MQSLRDFFSRIKQVSVSNLHPVEDEVREMGTSLPSTKLSLWTSSATIGERELLFSTSPASSTCNPTWDISAFTGGDVLEKHKDDQQVCLVITSDGEGGEVALFSVTFDLEINKLVLLRRLDMHDVLLPLNSLFLYDDEGVWTTSEITQTVPQLEPEVTEVTDASQPNSRTNDGSRDDKRRQSNENEESSCDEAEKVLNRVRELSLAQREVRKGADSVDVLLHADLVMWRKKAEVMEAEAAEEERWVSMEEKVLEDTGDIAAASLLCKEMSEAIGELEVEQKALIENGIKAKFLLEARQIKLVGELQTIYPIETQPVSGRYTIRGLEMPPIDCPQREEEQLTTALGYLVHLLLLLSKYLAVPLRYQLLYFSSRSMIKDAVSGHSMPLYRKDIDIERFKKAFVWLQRNVEQLLDAKGLVFDKKRHVLGEVNRLFQHLLEGKAY